MNKGEEMITEFDGKPITDEDTAGEATFLETFLELPEREEEVRKISDLLVSYQARFEKATSAYLQAITTLGEVCKERMKY